MQVSEDFLAYCWQTGIFCGKNLQTVEGESISVISLGAKNKNSGADFQMVCLELDGLRWVGSLEVHSLASDWFKHGHHQDPAYNNVILHLVWKNDQQAIRQDGSKVPQLVVEELIDISHYQNFIELTTTHNPIACSYGLSRVPPNIFRKTLTLNLENRLQRKSDEVLDLLKRNRQDWEETVHQLLAKALGFKINAEPFFQLAKRLPYKVLRKHADHLPQLEAMAFGVAGFLEDKFSDLYLLDLQNEYWYLSHKYKLDALPAGYWKFLRLRPPNFPTIRIAQWVALLHRFPNFFSRILFWQDKSDLVELFEAQQSTYWQQHYLPEKPTIRPTVQIGKDAVYGLIANVVCPILVAYSRAGNGEQFYHKAIEALELLPSEKNQIVSLWKELSVEAKSSFDSQALIELKTQNCDTKNCLVCPIGQYLISARH